jgi:hypothetical protein
MMTPQEAMALVPPTPVPAAAAKPARSLLYFLVALFLLSQAVRHLTTPVEVCWLLTQYAGVGTLFSYMGTPQLIAVFLALPVEIIAGIALLCNARWARQAAIVALMLLMVNPLMSSLQCCVMLFQGTLRGGTSVSLMIATTSLVNLAGILLPHGAMLYFLTRPEEPQ